jgi:phospholipid transport system substrate-binding protein
MKKLLLALILLFTANVSFAAMSPQELVEDTAEKVLTKLKQDRDKIKQDPAYLHGLVDEYVLPHFDFQRMAKWVLGKHWRKANADQRKRFVAEFKTLLVRTYASSLSEFSDQKLVYLSMRGKEAKGNVTVRSEVEQPGGFPIPINYRLHKKGDAWKVYDVTIDDISLIANYRSSFGREIRNAGLDALLKTLSKRNERAGS